MKAMTYQMVNSPEMVQAVNELVRVGRELGLTAGEFEDAATIAMHMVRNTAMNAQLKSLKVEMEDSGTASAASDTNFAVVREGVVYSASV